MRSSTAWATKPMPSQAKPSFLPAGGASLAVIFVVFGIPFTYGYILFRAGRELLISPEELEARGMPEVVEHPEWIKLNREFGSLYMHLEQRYWWYELFSWVFSLGFHF